MYPGPGGYQGELIAWDVANAKKVWSIKDPDFPVYSGVLVDRRRPGLLRHDGRLVPRRRCAHRQSPLAVQDWLRESSAIPMTFTRPGRQAIRRDLFGHWRMDGSRRAALGFHRRSIRRARRCRRHEARSRPKRNREICFMSSALSALCRSHRCCCHRSACGAGSSCASAPIPNNLPYSNEQQQGFENQIADLIAKDLDMQVSYFWFPQRGSILPQDAEQRRVRRGDGRAGRLR